MTGPAEPDWRHDTATASHPGPSLGPALWLLRIAGWILAFTVIGIPVALLIWLGVFVASLLFHLVGALHAWRGELYRYPWSVTLLR